MLTLVLLPGMDGTGELFTPFVRAFGSEFPVRIISYPTKEPLGYAELEAVARNQLPPEGSIILLGESFSGPIAISLAAACASRIKSLILCCSFARNPRPIFSGTRSFLGVLPVSLTPDWMLDQLLLGSFSKPELRSILSKVITAVDSSVIRARIAAVLSVDVVDQLATISAPVLYLRALSDRVVPRSASELALQFCPQMRIAKVNGPHLLLQAAPYETGEIVRAFVKETLRV